MKCQKCNKSAVVHLTELVKDESGASSAVEVHLCLGHAVEMGLIAAGSEVLGGIVLPSGTATPTINEDLADSGLPTAIVPQKNEPATLAVTQKEPDTHACPVCGTGWAQFKTTGLLGCPHDYEHFEMKLLPLLKRAQEGATQHVGKMPKKHATPDSQKQMQTLKLRRELQKALEVEDYKAAARLRDQLKTLEN